MTTNATPAAGEGLPFGLRVMALSPERREVIEAALADAERAQAAGETEVERLFRQWDARAYDGRDDDVTPLEQRIAETPATNLRDFAMKVVVWTVYGTEIVGATHMDEAMVAEMYALAGTKWPYPVRDGA